MNDEIKEILDRLDFEEWEVDLYKVPITWCELYDIRDYITNLQQDLEKANDIIAKDRQFYKSRMDEYVELKKENERLKEANVYCNRTDCSGRLKDSRKYDSVYQEKEDYKSRIDKAVEYIKENQEEEYVTGKPMLSYWAIDGLLNILQNGSEK